ncbi:MAG: adenylate/guanylate cyclase domain-containing protein [Candidatus Rokuibacteriota bacterium]
MRLSLKVKFSLLITALVVLTVALVGFFLLQQQQRGLSEEMTKRGLTMAENLASGAKSSLLTNDHLNLNVLVRDAMKDPDVAYVAITNPDGEILGHSDVAVIGGQLERPAGLALAGNRLAINNYATPDRTTIFDFSVPLTFSQVPLGALYLGFSDKSIAASLRQARNQAVVVTVVMVLLGVAGAVGLATVLARPIRRLVAGTRSIAEGDFNVTLPVTSRDELGDLTRSFNEMARALREKEAIKRAFTRYVAREVVEEILKNPESLVLSGQRREVTVLFCDVRGFTPLAERLNPEEVVLLLNEFYNLMIETTFKHDGTLDKFLGDGVMCIFGAPIARADHAMQAVRTAIDMQAGIAELNARFVREGRTPIAVGIGLSAGEVVAGTVGSEDRMEYTAIGDSVNLAARLESNAKPGQILISERTFEMVKDRIDAKAMGAVRVKGKEEEVGVYEVMRLTGAA